MSTGSLEDHGHHLASYDDTSLVVSAGVECGRRRRNVYDKKPQRCAKDNTTAHLTARSDKSVAYVTNNLKHSARRFVLLNLTTDRHQASRGLFATAELPVYPPLHNNPPRKKGYVYLCTLFYNGMRSWPSRRCKKFWKNPHLLTDHACHRRADRQTKKLSQ